MPSLISLFYKSKTDYLPSPSSRRLRVGNHGNLSNRRWLHHVVMYRQIFCCNKHLLIISRFRTSGKPNRIQACGSRLLSVGNKGTAILKTKVIISYDLQKFYGLKCYHVPQIHSTGVNVMVTFLRQYNISMCRMCHLQNLSNQCCDADFLTYFHNIRTDERLRTYGNNFCYSLTAVALRKINP
jgi:hypothetical protein